MRNYLRLEVLTSADFQRRRRKNETKCNNIDGDGAKDDQSENGDKKKTDNNNISEAVIALQSTTEQHATNACPAGSAGPALTRATAGRLFANHLTTSPNPSRFVFNHPSSPRTTSSHVNHAVRPITPPSINPHVVAPLTPNLSALDLS